MSEVRNTYHVYTLCEYC